MSRNLTIALLSLAACSDSNDTRALPDAPPPPIDARASTCTVALDATVTAKLAVTTDDNTKLYVNGALIDDLPRVWNDPQLYEVPLFRHPSRVNVIAVEGSNNANQDGADRGILVDLRFTAGAGAQTVVSDATWKVSATSPPGWEQPTFDDVSFGAPFVVGVVGVQPWDHVFATIAPDSTASWIWLDDPTGAASTKQTNQTTFSRKSFRVLDPSCP